MTIFRVDSEAVLATTGAVRGTMGRIQSDTTSLSSQLVGLQGSWDGPAATAFQQAAQEWRATQQRVDESLSALNRALTYAANQYMDTEQANTRLFAG